MRRQSPGPDGRLGIARRRQTRRRSLRRASYSSTETNTPAPSLGERPHARSGNFSITRNGNFSVPIDNMPPVPSAEVRPGRSELERSAESGSCREAVSAHSVGASRPGRAFRNRRPAMDLEAIRASAPGRRECTDRWRRCPRPARTRVPQCADKGRAACAALPKSYGARCHFPATILAHRAGPKGWRLGSPGPPRAPPWRFGPRHIAYTGPAGRSPA